MCTVINDSVQWNSELREKSVGEKEETLTVS